MLNYSGVHQEHQPKLLGCAESFPKRPALSHHQCWKRHATSTAAEAPGPPSPALGLPWGAGDTTLSFSDTAVHNERY